MEKRLSEKGRKKGARCRNCDWNVGSNPYPNLAVASFLLHHYISSVHMGFYFMDTRFLFLLARMQLQKIDLFHMLRYNVKYKQFYWRN